MDEALIQAADNLAQLEHIHEVKTAPDQKRNITWMAFYVSCFSSVQTLTTGQAEQVKREKARLAMEIKQATDKAIHAIHKWYEQ